MSDSRVEKLASSLSGFESAGVENARKFADMEIREVESAGLLVIDPDDDATVQRFALAEAEWWHGRERAMSMFPENWKTWAELDDATKAREANRQRDRAHHLLHALRAGAAS